MKSIRVDCGATSLINFDGNIILDGLKCAELNSSSEAGFEVSFPRKT